MLKSNASTRLMYDPCATKLRDKESMCPALYKLAPIGYRDCESAKNYATNMSEPGHQYKQYRNGCFVGTESALVRSTVTNPRLKSQLFTRPYVGSYEGAGKPSPQLTAVETALLQGQDCRMSKPCNNLSEIDYQRFSILPEYGNPQRVQHIVEPWVRGGDNTRDFVRRVADAGARAGVKSVTA